MKKLIVNADDFGLTSGVIDGIVQAHQSGIVTSTTLLINSPHLQEALAKLKAVPTLDLGIHLNITWGNPVCEPSKVKTLIDNQGRFIRRSTFEEINSEEVRAEWQAQIHKAKSLNLSLSHLDTHHHTHMHPVFLDILAEIAAEEKLAVRSQEEWVRDYLRANSIPTTDHFIGDFYGEGKTSPDHLQNLLRFIPQGTVEVCCHPAVVDAELMKTSSYNKPRGSELAALTLPELKDWLNQNEIVLSTFADLQVSPAATEKSCELIPEDPDPH